MLRSFRNRRVLLCLLASLAVHMLFLWAYQRWAAEPVLRALRPERFELAPALEPERFEPAPRASVPEVVMEQLRLAELMVEAALPKDAVAPPSMALESLAPEPALEAEDGRGPAFLPVDTVSYESALTDLYRRKLVELQGRRIRVLPLADITSAAGRRRNRAQEIIARAIEAMGGLERLQAIRDKRIQVETWNGERQVWVPSGVRSYLRGQRYRLDLAPRLARGHDGRQSWYLYYGLLMPPGDESYNAERWDFLTRFRGDGVVVEYVGRRQLHFPTLKAVRVIDTKFGRQRLAYFDMDDGLLYAEVEPCRTTTYPAVPGDPGCADPPRSLGSRSPSLRGPLDHPLPLAHAVEHGPDGGPVRGSGARLLGAGAGADIGLRARPRAAWRSRGAANSGGGPGPGDRSRNGRAMARSPLHAPGRHLPDEEAADGRGPGRYRTPGVAADLASGGV